MTDKQGREELNKVLMALLVFLDDHLVKDIPDSILVDTFLNERSRPFFNQRKSKDGKLNSTGIPMSSRRNVDYYPGSVLFNHQVAFKRLGEKIYKGWSIDWEVNIAYDSVDERNAHLNDVHDYVSKCVTQIKNYSDCEIAVEHAGVTKLRHPKDRYYAKCRVVLHAIEFPT